MSKREDILKWANEQKLSAHDVFDELNDTDKAIKTFYAEECPKEESGMVLSLHDAEILAYEYARRLLKDFISKEQFFETLMSDAYSLPTNINERKKYVLQLTKQLTENK